MSEQDPLQMDPVANPGHDMEADFMMSNGIMDVVGGIVTWTDNPDEGEDDFTFNALSDMETYPANHIKADQRMGNYDRLNSVFDIVFFPFCSTDKRSATERTKKLRIFARYESSKLYSCFSYFKFAKLLHDIIDIFAGMTAINFRHLLAADMNAQTVVRNEVHFINARRIEFQKAGDFGDDLNALTGGQGRFALFSVDVVEA